MSDLNKTALTTMPSSNTISSKQIYDARSSKYNESWHPEHAANYIRWAQPDAGKHVLDLACGTGLVSIAAKHAIGPTGTVTAVDISTGMMAVGKESAKKEGLDIQWLEWDITNLLSAKDEGKIRDDYDWITCATALVLLEDPLSAIKQWKELLKSGGRIITDVPTEKAMPQGMVFEEVGKEMGIEQPSRRLWVKDEKSLERLFLDAGFEIAKSWKAPGYLPRKDHGADEAGELFDRWTGTDFCRVFGEENVRDEARTMFIERFEKMKGKGGMVNEEDAFYMVIGRKV
jgi:ubiquinone/menaquinone biosynthesis C-methylase UbiE